MPNALTETAFELPIGSKKVAVPRWLLIGVVGGLIILLLVAKKGTAQATEEEDTAEEEGGAGIGEWLDQLEEELNNLQGPVEPPVVQEDYLSDSPRQQEDNKSGDSPSVTPSYLQTAEPFYSASPQSYLVQAETANLGKYDPSPQSYLVQAETANLGKYDPSPQSSYTAPLAPRAPSTNDPSPQSSYTAPLAPRATTTTKATTKATTQVAGHTYAERGT